MSHGYPSMMLISTGYEQGQLLHTYPPRPFRFTNEKEETLSQLYNISRKNRVNKITELLRLDHLNQEELSDRFFQNNIDFHQQTKKKLLNKLMSF